MKILGVYDISSNKLRNKVIKVLEKYGKRVQYSCFELLVDKDELKEVKEAIKKLEGNFGEFDKVYFYIVSYTTPAKKVGKKEELENRGGRLI